MSVTTNSAWRYPEFCRQVSYPLFGKPYTAYQGMRMSSVPYRVNTADEEKFLSRVATSNPDWRVKIAKGLDASSYYFVNGGQYQCIRPLKARAYYHWYQVTNPPNYYDRWIDFTSNRIAGSVPSTLGRTDSAVRDRALARLKSKISNYKGDKNVLTPVAELRELRGLIRGVAEQTGQVLVNLINLQRRYRGKELLKRASNAWLTWGFGIAPTLSDIRQTSASITAFLQRQDVCVRLVGSATGTQKWITDNQPGQDYLYPGCDVVVHSRGEFFATIGYKFIAGCEFKLAAGNNYDALSHFHLDIGGLVSALWELKAYSWVVDYFTTVGDFLDDVFVASGSATKFVVEDRRCQTLGLITLTPKPWSYVTVHETTPGLVKLDYFEFERTPLASLPTRSLRIKTIDEVGRYGITKVLNLAAVLLGHSRLSRKNTSYLNVT